VRAKPATFETALDLVGDVLAAVRGLGSRQPVDPLLGSASVAATMLDVFPDKVVIAVDWRTLPGTTGDDLLAALCDALAERFREVPPGYAVEARVARVCQHTWTGVERDTSLLTPGFLVAPDDKVVTAAARAVGRRGDVSRPAGLRPWTFATDGGWSRGAFGIPTVGFAPGEERRAHTNQERLDLEEARWAFARHPGLVMAVQNALAR